MPVEPSSVLLICTSGASLSCYKTDEICFIIIKLRNYLKEENFLGLRKEFIVDSIFTGDKVKIFSLTFGKRQKCQLKHLVFNIFLRLLDFSHRKG